MESASKSATLVAVSDYKRTLTKFYIEVNLKKVAQVDAILNKYKVSDEALDWKNTLVTFVDSPACVLTREKSLKCSSSSP